MSNNSKPIIRQNEKKKILIVEDETILALQLKKELTALGYEVTGVISRGEEVLPVVAEDLPDLILMDINLAGEMDGIAAAELINRRFHIPFIFLTSSDDEQHLSQAKAQHPSAYLLKPYQPRLLSITVHLAIYKADMEKALKESDQFGKAILNSLQSAILVVDKNGYVAAANFVFLTHVRSLGAQFQPKKGFNKSFYFYYNALFTCCDIEINESVLSGIQDVLHRRQISFSQEFQGAKNAVYEWLHVSVTPLKGRHKQSVIAITDISERKRAEQSLREREALVNASADAIIGIDITGRVTVWNPGAAALYGYNQKEAIGNGIEGLIVENRREELQTILYEIVQYKTPAAFETIHTSKDNSELEVSVSLSPIFDNQKNVTGIAMVVKKITELRTMERISFEIMENRINIISRYIQENLVQSLTGIAFKMKFLEETLSTQKSIERTYATTIKNSINDNINTLKKFLHDMSLVDFESQDLPCIVETLISTFKKLSGINISFNVTGNDTDEEYYLKINLYRFTQEALFWTINRSDLEKIFLELSIGPKEIYLTVIYHVCDGRVFLNDFNANTAYNLMKYRADILRAIMTVKSENPSELIVSFTIKKT